MITYRAVDGRIEKIQPDQDEESTTYISREVAETALAVWGNRPIYADRAASLRAALAELEGK